MSKLQDIRAGWDEHAKALNRRYYNASGHSMTLRVALSSARKVKGRARRVANRIIQLDKQTT